MKVLEIKNNDAKRSTLSLKKILDCTPKTKENMLNNLDEINKPFVYSHITSKSYLHIGDYFFRFFEKTSEMQLYANEQAIYEINEKMEQDDYQILARGPFAVSEENDNYLYIYNAMY